MIDHFIGSLRPEALQQFDKTEKLRIMELFLEYTRLLREFSQSTDPSDSNCVARVFGFKVLEGDSSRFVVNENTYLHQQLQDSTPGCFISKQQLNDLIRSSARDRVREMAKVLFGLRGGEDTTKADSVPTEHSAPNPTAETGEVGRRPMPAINLPSHLPYGGRRADDDAGHIPTFVSPLLPRKFDPCPHYTLFKRCNREPCTREHIEFNPSWYNERRYQFTLQISAIWEANRSLSEYHGDLRL